MNSSIISFSLFTSRTKRGVINISVCWVLLQVFSFTQPFQPASFLSCQGLTACSLHLSGSLPDGFCLALSFLGIGTGIRRLLKAKCCFFSPLLEGAWQWSTSGGWPRAAWAAVPGGGGSVCGTAAPRLRAKAAAFFFFFFFHFMCCCGILVPEPGMEAKPPAWEALSLHTGLPGKSPKAGSDIRLIAHSLRLLQCPFFISLLPSVHLTPL